MLCSILDAKAGMVVDQDVLMPGTRIVLINQGHVLDHTLIDQLKRWRIDSLEMHLPDEQEGDAELERIRKNSTVVGDTVVIGEDVQARKNELRFSDRVKIEGNVLEGTVIRAEKDLMIAGKVMGASLYSNANIMVMGGVEGRGVGLIEAKGDIKAAYFKSCRINSKTGSIYADFEIQNCKIKAKNSLQVGIHQSLLTLEAEFSRLQRGAIKSGTITVGDKIETLDLGSEKHEDLEVQVINYDMLFIASELMKIEETMKKKLLEYKQIEKHIELIKVLGNNIVNLSAQKQYELKEFSDNYFNLKNEIIVLNQRMTFLKQEKEVKAQRFKDRPLIKVYQKIYPGVTIGIDQMKFQVKYSEKRVAFYKKGMIIMAKLEEE